MGGSKRLFEEVCGSDTDDELINQRIEEHYEEVAKQKKLADEQALENFLQCEEEMPPTSEDSDISGGHNMEVTNLFSEGLSMPLIKERVNYYFDILTEDIHCVGDVAIDENMNYYCSFCEDDTVELHGIYTPDEFKRICNFDEDLMQCKTCGCFLFNTTDIKDEFDDNCKKVHDEFFVTECANNFSCTF